MERTFSLSCFFVESRWASEFVARRACDYLYLLDVKATFLSTANNLRARGRTEEQISLEGGERERKMCLAMASSMASKATGLVLCVAPYASRLAVVGVATATTAAGFDMKRTGSL